MTPTNKRRFLRELTKNILNDAITKVDRMPDHWDGIELRRFLADKFAESAMCMPKARGHEGRRRRDYENEVITRNL